MKWCNQIRDKGSPGRVDLGTISIIDLFSKNNKLLEVYEPDGKDGIIDNYEVAFRNHVIENLVFSYGDCDHLPIPVFSYTKPTLSVFLILYIMLSMQIFET